jgi:glutathione S-transferase
VHLAVLVSARREPLRVRQRARQAAIEKTESDAIPEVLGYLERELPTTGLLFGADPSIADVTIAAVFRNLELARYRIDSRVGPRPRCSSRARLRSRSSRALRQFEDVILRIARAQHRKALAELGAPLS